MRSRSIDFVMVNGKVSCDANGIAKQTIIVSSTVKGQADKVKTPVICPHFRDSDVGEVDGDPNSVCVTLPESWDAERFLKALNQGTRLLAQQPVHMKFTETGLLTKHREAVNTFVWQNVTDPDVIVLMTALAKCGDDNKARNALRDKFYQDFIADDDSAV